MFGPLPTLQKLIRQLQKVPYLASKNIYRVANYFLLAKDDDIRRLCDVILQAKENVKACSVCFNWTEGSSLCSVCSAPRRDKSIICVVQTWHDLLAVEKAGGYNGVYHVLGGVMCPLEGIGPEDLNIESLIKRVDKSVSELIFATNPTPEGEATASFISSRLAESDLGVKISKLASGVPIGSTLEFMDRVTIYKALSERRPF